MHQPIGRHSRSDVLVVGAGPVGLATALFLARDGWQVTILEQWPSPYPLPRAVHFDDEVARLLADAGIGDRLGTLSEPADTYEWRNADGTPLLTFDWSGPGPSGWPRASMTYQPDLETALAEALETHPNVSVLRGHEAVGLVETERDVTLTARDTTGRQHELSADWVVGADGANSFVRAHMPTRMTDLGFFYDWLIVDIRPRIPRTWDPVNLQICDPQRPTTVVSGGPGRRRWEFMRMPGESVEELDTESAAWRLLAPFGMTPETCDLERHAVYTFQAQWADTWRTGRLLLAGDSAHLMPPFAGQGMCSGIRDAANLTFKLDLVLRGAAAPALLDTYGTERSAHVQHAIGMSVELGKVICVTDPGDAAMRDAHMISHGADPERALPPLPPTVLSNGLIACGEAGTAGLLSRQARISYRGRVGLLNGVVGRGFVVASATDPRTMLSARQLAFLKSIRAHLLHLTPPGAHADEEVAAVDLDGFYLPHLAVARQAGVVIRPDHYLFGTAATPEGLARLVDDLEKQLVSPRSSTSAVPSPTPVVTAGGES
ncbi:bifunctional 3-(3-hydroxy-phenyl)propionate/3-hydroxycinnamic acid hydroxylase [Streptomyces sp. NBC_01460]|uniref:bifunctional 3-(3-hydroxy-phenyl)propionate/3-hydroxycinnamic acid hydroxylase MhpA n=1 Tax=Streptomyces sp. NBC_01460 TaxID=2903875 RepID=UPI002E2F8BDA|nr:bifunctional 3-(3-hydroxy-phenyl)propionate/3-hydroxycinnamic acid hydroxylase [Streptomyces sp. NBC_01460]